jgi:hypothetical protein
MGFQEHVISEDMSFFSADGIGFYLQQAYVKDWIENTMLFLEVDDVARHQNELLALGLQTTYDGVRTTPIRESDWGREYFIHDPSGILWHIGEFYK